MNTGAKIALGIVGVGFSAGAGYLIWYYLRNNTTDGAFLMDAESSPITRAVALAYPWPENFIRWDANSVLFVNKRGAPPPFQWPRAVEENGGRPLVTQGIAAIPGDARTVPLIRGSTRTPLCAEPIDPASGDDRARYLNRIREVISASRALRDADPRIILVLWSKESNWDRSVHNNNPGNVKADRRCYAPDYAYVMREQKVYTAIPRCDGIYCLVDGTGSFDGYPSFASLTDYCDYFASVISGPRYGDAWSQLKRGGIQGLTGFATAIGGVYSKTSKAEYVRWMTATWNSCESKMGAARWVR